MSLPATSQPRRRPRGRLRLLLAPAALLVLAAPASGFSVGAIDPANVPLAVEQAARWAPETGLADGLEVGVAPGFAEALGANTASEIAAVREAVGSALLAWRSPSLRFSLLFDDPDWQTREIGLVAEPIAGPFFGFTLTEASFLASRTLTNGQASPGAAISGAVISIDPEKTLQLAADFGYDAQERLDGLQRLIMHETGHAIGLFHPNGDDPFAPPTPNLDQDDDPFDAMFIDPADPFGALIVSDQRDGQAIMSNTACGIPPSDCPALLFTALRGDDRGGRDALYPYAAPLIEIAPEVLDFGMLEIGQSAQAIATFANVGTTPLTVSGFDLTLSFGCGGSGFDCVDFIAAPPPAPLVLLPGESADYPWTCVANEPGVGMANGGAILSDDPLRPAASLELLCRAVAVPPPPDEQVAAVAAFVDESVEAGTLEGSGSGGSAAGRLGAFRNMLDATAGFFGDGADEAGCEQLADVRDRADGDARPPDFVRGADRGELDERLSALAVSLGCP